MQRQKILFVITKLELGGAQLQLLHLVRHLAAKGYSVTVFTARSGILLDDFKSISSVAVIQSRFLERPLNCFKDICALYELFAYLSRNRFAIVHTHSSKAGIIGRVAARMAGVRAVYHTVHGWPFHPYQSHVIRSIYVFLERLCARWTRTIIVVSDSDREKGLRYAIGAATQYAVIRYAVVLQGAEKTPAEVRRAFGIAEHQKLITTVACLKPQKSPEDFVRMAHLVSQSCPDTKFLLVGDGALRERVSQCSRRYGLGESIIIAGWRRDVEAILSASDVFVLTSLWEGLPIAVLEAIASRVPVAVTDTGGVAEVVRDKTTGFLVAPGDMQAMADAVKAIVADPDLRAKITQNAFDALKGDYTITTMVARTLRVYEQDR